MHRSKIVARRWRMSKSARWRTESRRLTDHPPRDRMLTKGSFCRDAGGQHDDQTTVLSGGVRGGLAGGCGPEAMPARPVAVAENTVVSQEQATIEVTSATPVISATLPAADVAPTVSATLTPTLDLSEFPNPDSFKIDIFQIAAEQMAEGPASFPIQATVGEGENTLHVAAKDVGTFQFPCAFSPSPDRKHYACLTGGGMDGHVWISQWGVGPERLLTEHAVFAIAWSPNGDRLTYGTLDGIDENWTGTLRLHDLANGEDVVLGNIAAPWQTIFTSNNQLIYLHDHALQIWSIPAEKSLKG